MDYLSPLFLMTHTWNLW